MSKFEKVFLNTFKVDNPDCYLFSDTYFIKKVDDFDPERQWQVACGILFKEDNLRRYFTSVLTKSNHFLNIIVPTNTFYDEFYVYDHDYIENQSLEILWRDMFYNFSFKKIKDKDFEHWENYMNTQGRIIKQTDTHILLEVEKYIHSGFMHKEIQKDFKYLSIPKSYIRSIRLIGGEWQRASLKKVVPRLAQIILGGDISYKEVKESCNNFLKSHKNKKSFLYIKRKKINKVEYGISYSYLSLDLDFKYIGNINFNFFNRIKEKFFLKRIDKDKYILTKTK